MTMTERLRTANHSCGSMAAVMLLAFLGLGCSRGDGRISVSGTVSLDRQPLSNGFISFMPAGPHGSPAGGPIAAGRYAAKVSPGEMVVEIRATQQVPKEHPVASDVERGTTTVQQEIVPERYNKQTTLRILVSGTSRQHDFQLSSAPE